MASRRSQSAGA